MSERSRGIAFVLLAALLWSTGGLGIKLAEGGPMAIGGVRSLFALPVLIWAFRSSFASAGPTLRRPGVWAAAVSYAVCVTTFAASTRLTTSANAIVLQYTGPIYVALLSGPFLGERPRTPDYVALGGCLVGMLLFSREDLSATGSTGIALALVSGVAFGLLPLFLRREIASGAPLEAQVLAILLGNVLAVVGTLPFIILSPPVGLQSWVSLALLGTFQIACAYLAFARGLRYLRAVEASVVQTVEPVLNPVWVWLGVGEVPGPWAVGGGLVVVASVLARSIWPAPATIRE